MKHILPYKIYENNTSHPNADLHNAVISDDVLEVKRALIADVDINSLINNFTPLMKATKYGAILSLKVLIEAGADINMLSPYNDTALSIAAVYGRIEWFKILINAGADLNIPYSIDSQAFKNIYLYNSNKFRMWLLSEDGQEFILPKFPKLIQVFIKDSIAIKKSVKVKFPYLFTGTDLNLL